MGLSGIWHYPSTKSAPAKSGRPKPTIKMYSPESLPMQYLGQLAHTGTKSVWPIILTTETYTKMEVGRKWEEQFLTEK